MDAPNAKFTPEVEVCQPNLPFDNSNRGNPRCVDISHKSGVVVVGTDIGMLLVYKFNIPRMTNAAAGKNETNEINLVMEIKTPPTAFYPELLQAIMRLLVSKLPVIMFKP